MVSKRFGSLCFGKQENESHSLVICQRLSIASKRSFLPLLSVELFFGVEFTMNRCKRDLFCFFERELNHQSMKSV
jgi:hypothetical protein